MTEILTYDFLSECFDADFEEGTLRWRVRPLSHFEGGGDKTWNTKYAGKIAGYIRTDARKRRYVYVGIAKKMQFVHRLLYAMNKRVGMNDVPPIIDHEDGNSLNNRIGNLRPATNSQNSFNRPKPKNNTSGFKGAVWNSSKKKWEARICSDELGDVFLGYFDTVQEAAAAYRGAAKILHREFFRDTTQAAA